MSQCHDIYDPLDVPETRDLEEKVEELNGDQCHDSYENESWAAELLLPEANA